MSDDLADRRAKREKLTAQYQGGFDGLFNSVVAEWREIWVKDCREKRRTISFEDWCHVPLVEDDPMSTPFEIANVY